MEEWDEVESGGVKELEVGELAGAALFRMLCSRFRGSQVSFANAAILSLLDTSGTQVEVGGGGGQWWEI